MRMRLEKIIWTCDRCGRKHTQEGLAVGFELPFGWDVQGSGTGAKDICGNCRLIGEAMEIKGCFQTEKGITGKRLF